MKRQTFLSTLGKEALDIIRPKTVLKIFFVSGLLWRSSDCCSESKTKKVEASSRKLRPADEERFPQAMRKEWTSWVENNILLPVVQGVFPKKENPSMVGISLEKEQESKPRPRKLDLPYRQDPDLDQIATVMLHYKALGVVGVRGQILEAVGLFVWRSPMPRHLLASISSRKGMGVFDASKEGSLLVEAFRAWFTRPTCELTQL